MDFSSEEQKIVWGWFEDKPNKEYNDSFSGKSVIIRVPEVGYAEILTWTRFAGKNIWPGQKKDCWNTLWTCAGFPLIREYYWEDEVEGFDPDIWYTNESRGLARLIASGPAQKLLKEIAIKHNLYALYNPESTDIGTPEGAKGIDSYSINLAVPLRELGEELSQETIEGNLESLYTGTLEFITLYQRIRKLAIEKRSTFLEEINNAVDSFSRISEPESHTAKGPSERSH